MGGTWLPDPSIGSSFSDDISFPSVVMIDSDNEDADIIDNERERIINYNEYHLLNNDDNLPDWEENSNSDTEDSEEEHITSDANPSDPSPISDNDSEPTENTHRDIAVDFEQVKAAMTRVTLPPSATPSWATSIPDSEWRSYLQNRILSMQERPNILKESETTPK